MALRFSFLVDLDREVVVADTATARLIDQLADGGYRTGDLITLQDALKDLSDHVDDLYSEACGRCPDDGRVRTELELLEGLAASGDINDSGLARIETLRGQPAAN